jgi:hypothetical protein
MALLMSARIRASTALDAARAMFRRRWTTVPRMAEASWEERARVLSPATRATTSGPPRRWAIPPSFSSTDTAAISAGFGAPRERDQTVERRLLKQCKGIGDVGVDIFFRDAQRTWDELYPFADRRAREAARRLGLADDAEGLTRLGGGDDFVRLVNGLVRVDLDDVYNDVIALASGRQ